MNATTILGKLLLMARREGGFIGIALTSAIVYTIGLEWFDDLDSTPATTLGLFIWIFVIMMWGSFAVVRHADALAELLGEPYGTLILTVSVITIEVAMIVAIMLSGESNPTLARDTMLAVLMIVLNGMIGLALLIGGFRHGEQDFNLQGARSFVSVLVTLATLTLVLPRFTTSTSDGSLTTGQAAFFITVTMMLYATFLVIQTIRHRGFFVQPTLALETLGTPSEEEEEMPSGASIVYHLFFLVAMLVCIVLLSKKLALLTDHGMTALSAPHALGGILIAVLVLAPEGLAALRAAVDNRLQRSVNICLGSALATIGLTVPAVLTISLFENLHLELGLDLEHMVLLVLTLLLSVITFGGGRTNMLQGAVHLVVFMVYILLVFAP